MKETGPQGKKGRIQPCEFDICASARLGNHSADDHRDENASVGSACLADGLSK